jgi:hypothetical protein
VGGWDSRVAAESGGIWEAGFCFSEGAGRGVCGWVLFRLGCANRSCRRFTPRNWHGCPIHATWPKQNAEFWLTKISKNQARDRLVNRELRKAGWRVLRIWEHDLTRKRALRTLGRIKRAVAEKRGRA